jgi:hypothetical protein
MGLALSQAEEQIELSQINDHHSSLADGHARVKLRKE